MNETLLEVMGATNAFLNVDLDDDLTQADKGTNNTSNFGKKGVKPSNMRVSGPPPNIPNRDSGQGIAREIFSDDKV